MINLKQEIETFLNSNWCNTNDKEQNMQGRLYAWLLRFEQQGYTVEMETSVRDEHIKCFNNKACKDNFPIEDFAKKEMDLFIFNKDFSEVYAAELKWIYKRDEGWNILDNLEDFKDDAKFCYQLVEHGRFTETCSVVVQDFEESKQVQRCSWSRNKPEVIRDKQHFLGRESYPSVEDLTKLPGGSINVKDNDSPVYLPFEWKDLHQEQKLPNPPKRQYRYYILDFNQDNVSINENRQ